MKKETNLNGPEPLPKLGDIVEYLLPVSRAPLAARVVAIHARLEGRVLDLDVDTGVGVSHAKSIGWRADGAGNTWHWPE